MRKYAKIKPLVKDPGSLDVQQVAETLARSLEGMSDGAFEYHVIEEKGGPPVRLDFRGGKPAVSREPAGKVDFALKADPATTAAIAAGTLSPVDAYLSGRMEVHGDLGFGKRLFAKLAAAEGQKEL